MRSAPRFDRLLQGLAGEKAASLAAHGSFEVLSPQPASEQDEVHFRTVVDLDGDVVTTVAASHLNDTEARKQHFDKVARAVDEALGDIRRALRLLSLGIGASVTSASVFASSSGGLSSWEAVGSLTAGGVAAGAVSLLKPVRSGLTSMALGWIGRRSPGRTTKPTPLETLQKHGGWEPWRIL